MSLLCYLSGVFIHILFQEIPILSRFQSLPTPGYCVKVTGKKSGKKASKTLKATITVKNPTIKLTGASTVTTGETTTLKATVKPSNAKVTYSSSDKTVATVSSKGVVTGVKSGSAIITASVKSGNKTAKATQKITVVDATTLDMTELTATSASTLTAKFANPVAENATVTVNKAGLTAAVDGKVTWNATRTEAAFSTTANLTAGDYTMTVKTDAETTSKTVKVLNEYVKDIVIKSTQALTKPGDKKTAYVFYDVLNQYGESVRLSTTISWSSSAKSITADKTTGKLTIISDNDFVYGNQIYVTGVYTKTGVSVQKAVSIGMERALNSVKAIGFVNKNKPSEKIDSLPVDFAKNTYYMVYETRDQDNNLMDAAGYVASKDVTFISDNILLVKIDSDNEKTFTIDGIEYSAIAVEPGQYVDKGGEVNITAIANKTGNKSNTNFTVGSNALLQTLSITGTDKIVADGDQNVKLNYVAKDTTGKDVTNYETIVRSTNTLNLSCGTGTLTVKEENDGTAGIYWSDDVKYNAWNNNENADEIDRTIPLTTIVVGGESNNYLLSVSDKRRPVAIKDIKSINGGANAIVANGTATIDFSKDSDVEYIDQYGETMKATVAAEFFDFAGVTKFGKGTKYAYGVLADFTDTNSLESGDSVLKTGNYRLTLTADNVEAVTNDTVKFSIAQADNATDEASKWDVTGKVLSLSISDVPVELLSNLSIPAVAKQYVVTAYTDKANGAAANLKASDADVAVTGELNVPTNGEVKVTGTYDGKTLTVPEAYLNRTDANFTYASGKISAVSAGALKVKDLYDVNSAQLTRKDGSLEAAVKVYKTTSGHATADLLGTCKTKVALSDEAPKAAKVEWTVGGKAVDAFTANANNTGYGFTNARTSGLVVVYDQYGNKYTAGTVEFTVKDYVENTGAFAHKQNSFKISTNGSDTTAIDGAELGDTFVVTATINGVSAQAKVTLGSDTQANINNNANSDESFRKAKLGYDR